MNEKRMEDLRRSLTETLRGVVIEEHLDLDGYIIRDATPDRFGQHTALYTAYVAEEGFSSYIAINDNRKGIEIEDERLLAEKAPLADAVARIKADHAQHGGAYPKTRSTLMLYSVDPKRGTYIVARKQGTGVLASKSSTINRANYPSLVTALRSEQRLYGPVAWDWLSAERYFSEAQYGVLIAVAEISATPDAEPDRNLAHQE